MTIAGLISGGLLLAFGRRLFWLFVAAAGFFAGMRLAESLSPARPGVGVFVGLALGLVAALLAVFVQRLAIFVGGFLAGGYLLVTIAGLFAANPGRFSWLLFLIGGVLGAILLNVIFDWALIILSSLVGAVLVARYSGAQAPVSMLLVVALFIAGMVIQGGLLKRLR